MVSARSRGAMVGRLWRLALVLAVLGGLVLTVRAGAGGSVGAAHPAKGPTGSGSELPGPDPLLRELIGFRVRYRDLLKRHAELVRRRHGFLPGLERRDTERDPGAPEVVRAEDASGNRVGDFAPRARLSRANAKLWGGLPAFGPFAVVNPQGQGRVLTAYSWGWRGEISDLARMPKILEAALPWFHVDHSRVYAIGSSMGGQETLLLAAKHPKLLTAAAPLDSPTDMAARYWAFATVPSQRGLQRLARIEIGGTPTTNPQAYAARSPMSYVKQLATGGVPIDIWWSRKDKIVVNQNRESGRLYRAIMRVNPKAPVEQFVGTWAHSHEMSPLARLPLALVDLKLVELDEALAKTVKP